jgi:DNA segregation ATPase FtsK/SpoIIIE-like protein
MAGVALLVLRPGRAGQRVNAKAGEPAFLPVRSAIAPSETSEDPLLPEARQWVDRLRGRGTTVLVYPVSRLQREFRLGYARACALADCLAQRGEWTVAYDGGGTHYARIHRMA